MGRLRKNGYWAMTDFKIRPSKFSNEIVDEEEDLIEQATQAPESEDFIQKSQPPPQEEIVQEEEAADQKFNVRPSKFSPEKTSAIPYVGPTMRGISAGALGIAGDLNSLIEGSASWTYDQSFGRLLHGSPEESKASRERLDERSKVRFGEDRKRLPGVKEFYGYIDALTGDALQPGTAGERRLGKAGEFLGGALLPLGKAKEGLKLAGAIGAFLGGAAVQEAEERGVGPLGQLGIGLVTSLLSESGATKAGSAISQLKSGGWRNLIRQPARGAAHVPLIKAKPNSEIGELIKAAEQEGITLPLSAMTDSSATRYIEKVTSKMATGRQAYKNLFNKTNQEFVDAYKRNLNKISITDFGERFEAGLTAQQGLKQARDVAAERVRTLYRESIEALPAGAAVSDNGIRAISEKMSSELKKSLIPSAEEKATKSEFNELLKNLEALEPKKSVKILGADGKPIKLPKGKAQPIPVNSLVATERSLNDLINYEKQGGSKKLLIQAQKKVGEALKKYSESSPAARDWYQNHSTAKKGFADLAQRFRNNVVDSALKNEKPEFILNHMGTKSGIKKVGAALSETKEGAEIFESLKRFKLEEMIGRKVINAGTGEVKYQAAASALANPKDQEVFRTLMGEKNYVAFQNLQKVSKGIQKGFNEFLNPSRTADVNLANASGLGAVQGIVLGVGTGNPLLVKASAGVLAGPWVMSKLLTNENFLKETARLAKAGNQGNRANFDRSLQALIPMIQDVMTEASDYVEYEGEDEMTDVLKQFDTRRPGEPPRQ